MMPKRKWVNYIGTAANRGPGSSKRAKSSQSSVERRQPISHSAKRQRRASSNNTASESVISSQHTGRQDQLNSEPPPELTRGQRKRWRKRHKRQAGTDSASTSHLTEAHGSHVSQESPRPPVEVATSATNASREQAPSRSILEQLAITKLLPRPQKQWRSDGDGAEVADATRAHRCNMDNESLRSSKKNAALLSSSPTVKQQRRQCSTALQSKTMEPNGRSRPEADDQANNQASLSKLSGATNDLLKHSNNRESTKSSMAESLPQRKKFAGPEQMGSQKVATARHLEGRKNSLGPSRSIEAASSISFRPSRPSFGHKANSVPSYSNDLDAATAFKRFSAFLKGSAAEGSDEASDDESDIGSDGADTEVGQKSGEQDTNDELIEISSACCNDPEVAQDTNIALTHYSSTAKVMQSDRVDELPSLSEDAIAEKPPTKEGEDIMTTRRATTATSYPANVRVKRYASFFGREPGGTGFDSGLTLDDRQADDKHPHRPSSTILSPGEPLNVLQDEPDDVLMQNIAEVTGNVFKSITPLHIGKRSVLLDGREGDGELGNLADVLGDCRMTRSMRSARLTPRKENPKADFLPAQQSTVLVYNVDTSETRHETAPEPDGVVTSLSEEDTSVSENINVAIDLPGDRQIDALESSSSLSELGLTPSPPVETSLGKSKSEDGRSTDFAPRYENSVTASKASDAPSRTKKKRKMTGRTSKHFTPEKRHIMTPSKVERDSMHEVNAEFCSGETLTGLDKEELQCAGEPSAAAGSICSGIQRGMEIPKREKEGREREYLTPVRRTRRSRDLLNSDINFMEDLHSQHLTGGSAEDVERGDQDEGECPPAMRSTRSSTKTAIEQPKRKGTGKKSAYFTPTKPAPDLDLDLIDRVDLYNSTGRTRRVPAGTSTHPMPSTTSERFGIIQEKLWREPFWLLIAVTFLNKTAGRAAAPIFWSVKERYPTPELLSKANEEDLRGIVYHLGLQTQRSRRLIHIARAWAEAPPAMGRRFRTLHYPTHGDGKVYKASEAVEEDADECAGALEIGHIPGCGPYAWDSWRIFCRDILRGLADDYNSKNAGSRRKFFVPEWQKVVPLDKELRACLRWMWLREGWIWDHNNGGKRRATGEEMQKAVHGEMDIVDPQERKFAAQAAAIELLDSVEKMSKGGAAELDMDDSKWEPAEEEAKAKVNPSERSRTPDDEEMSDNVVVPPAHGKASRRSARLTT